MLLLSRLSLFLIMDQCPPYFSTSLPFAANSIWLRTPHGEPFIAVYEVAAEVVQPQAFIADIENTTTTTGDMSGMNLSG